MKSILLVDDMKHFRLTVRELMGLRPELLVVCEASNGAEAIREAKALRPDLIILDVRLPELNGFEVVRQLRIAAPDSKIIFLSLEDSPEIVAEAFNLGACAYIWKYDVLELLSAIDAVTRGETFRSCSVR